MKIPFNKPFFAGNEMAYIKKAVSLGKISGNGIFTSKCHKFFKDTYGFNNCLITSSCTDALEMAAILCRVQPGDEVIAPAYSFVSTVNAFVLRGARIVFADSKKDHPNIDTGMVESLITKKTKVIIVIHYAGIACDMDPIMEIAKTHNLLVVEDAAQAIDSYYKNRPLGSIGNFGTFSFHETKNIISGEGGMLVVNDNENMGRAEVIWEKGTNRVAFSKGHVNKYQWVDVGSSFLPSEITAAFLFAQLEHLKEIQNKRQMIWRFYFGALSPLEKKGIIKLPLVHDYATNNYHIFYITCESKKVRDDLLTFLNGRGIYAVFHYLSLNESPFFQSQGNQSPILPNAKVFESCLLRLPLYVDLTGEEQEYIVDCVNAYFSEA